MMTACRVSHQGAMMLSFVVVACLAPATWGAEMFGKEPAVIYPEDPDLEKPPPVPVPEEVLPTPPPLPPPPVDNVDDDGCKVGFCGFQCTKQCIDVEGRCSMANATHTGITCSKDCSTIERCEVCQPGYWGPACEETCVSYQCDQDNRIECNKYDGSLVMCNACNDGYAGRKCEQPVRCVQLAEPANGYITPKTCLSEQKGYGRKCNYHCNPGYKLVHSSLDNDNASFCENPLPGTKVNPSLSCLAIKKGGPRLESGYFYLKKSAGDGDEAGGASEEESSYKAFCDLDADKGGWEVMWKNLGGYHLPNRGHMNDEVMVKRGLREVEELFPPMQLHQDEHVSARSTNLGAGFKEKDAHWIKLMTLYQTDGKFVKQVNIHFELFNISLSEVFETAEWGFGEQGCEKIVGGHMNVFVNNKWVGRTDHLWKDGDGGFGPANFKNQCNQKFDNLVYVPEWKGIEIFRLDRRVGDKPDSHESLSRIFTTSKQGQDASQVFCHWASLDGEVMDKCAGHYETYWWGYRPGVATLPAKMLIGTWSGSLGDEDPKCEALECESMQVEMSKNVCEGKHGDACVPEPVAGYECIGYLKCDGETGKFEVDPLAGGPEVGCFPEGQKCFQSSDCTSPHHRCVDNKCECVSGYYGNSSVCYPVTQCKDFEVEAVSNTSTRDRVCKDRNECEEQNGGCEQLCTDTVGGYYCSCNVPGYEPKKTNPNKCVFSKCLPYTPLRAAEPCQSVTGKDCDLKCIEGYQAEGKLTCDEFGLMDGDGKCVGSPCEVDGNIVENQAEPCEGVTDDVCRPACKSGYQSEGSLTCRADGKFHGNARCVPKFCEPRRPGCETNEGKKIDASICTRSKCIGTTGMDCKPVNSDDQSAYFECLNGWEPVGSFQCRPDEDASYLPRFVGNAACRDINECEINNGGCDQVCNNYDGGHFCSCSVGYTMYNDTCLPNHCQKYHVPNAHLACEGRHGDKCFPVPIEGYECTGHEECLHTGIFTQGKAQCKPIRCTAKVVVGAKNNPAAIHSGQQWIPHGLPGWECTGAYDCGLHSSRVLEGSAICTKKPCEPFAPNGSTTVCEGVHGDLCFPAGRSDGRDVSGVVCTGSLKCDGDTGHFKGHYSCLPSKRCTPGMSNCTANADCRVSQDRTTVGTCRCSAGFFGNGVTCSKCSPCGKGEYVARECDGGQDTVCEKVDPCETANGGCNQLCSNVDGKAVCSCRTGFGPVDLIDNQCVPRSCATWEIQGSQPCNGPVGTKCNAMPQPGWTCSGSKTCDISGSFVGYASCRKIRCEATSREGWDKPCSGEFGHECRLSCSYGYRVRGSGVVKCGVDGTYDSGAGCVRTSSVACGDLMGLYTAVDCKGFSSDTCEACGDPTGELTEGCIGKETGGVPFAEAKFKCIQAGARLCTADEVIAGAFYAPPTNYQSEPIALACPGQPVWTGDECGGGDSTADSALVIVPDYTNYTVNQKEMSALLRNKFQCVEKATTPAMGLCCADVTPARKIDECAAGLDDCDHINGGCRFVPGKGGECYCNDDYVLAENGTCIFQCMAGTSEDPDTGECVEQPGFRRLTYENRDKQRTTDVVQYGRFEWTPKSGECFEVAYSSQFEGGPPASVQVSISESDYVAPPPVYDDHDARMTWVEGISDKSFTACLAFPGGTAADRVVISWVAFNDFPGGRGGEVMMPVDNEAGHVPICVNTPLTDLPFAPERPEQVLVTPSHRYSASVAEGTHHEPVFAWVGRFTETEMEVCAVRKGNDTLESVVVDYVVFDQPMKGQDVYVGSTAMGEMLCEVEQARELINERASRLGGVPCRCKVYDEDDPMTCLKWAKGFEWSSGNVYCENIFYREDEADLRKVPNIQLTVDHRHDKVVGDEYGAVTAWVEWATPRNFRVCYEDMFDHNYKLLDPRTLNWLAIV